MRNANIVAFPAPFAPGAAHPPFRSKPPALARAALDIDLVEIAHRLGMDRLEAATIVKHLRTLSESSGFPLPRTTRFWRGQEVRGPRLIVAGAIWNRFEVDRWFEDRDPPATRAARQRHRREQLREEMAGRAVAIAQITGRKRA